MNRIRILEYARNKVAYFKRIIEQYEEQIADYEDDMNEYANFLTAFDYDKNIRDLACTALVQYHESPSNLRDRIKWRRAALDQASFDLTKWMHFESKLLEMWPDLAGEIEE